MTKDQVIAILRRAKEYVSGEEISRTLGISRMAVNTAVQSLRKDGYTILSATNKGYRLSGSPDMLSAGELLALLPKERMERVICLDTVDSTNNYLRRMAQYGAPDGQIVLSNEQTGGRGRMGRSFSSPKDKGIYLSMLMRPDSVPAETANMTAWAAEAMCDAVETAGGVRPGIKWVNDLVMNKRKICGILTEMSVESESGHIQYLITGIGVNVNHTQQDFPEELHAVASSLAMETGKPWNRAQLAAQMILALDRLRSDWPDQKARYLKAYRRDCLTLGKEIRFTRGAESGSGTAVDIDDSFGLIVHDSGGQTRSLSSGEVSVRGLYGYV